MRYLLYGNPIQNVHKHSAVATSNLLIATSPDNTLRSVIMEKPDSSADQIFLPAAESSPLRRPPWLIYICDGWCAVISHPLRLVLSCPFVKVRCLSRMTDLLSDCSKFCPNRVLWVLPCFCGFPSSHLSDSPDVLLVYTGETDQSRDSVQDIIGS